MKPIEVFEAVDRVVKLENIVRQLFSEPLRSTDIEAGALIELSQRVSGFLTKISLDDLKKYHIWMNSRITNLEQQYESMVTEYEERLRQAELDAQFRARYSAHIQG